MQLFYSLSCIYVSVTCAYIILLLVILNFVAVKAKLKLNTQKFKMWYTDVCSAEHRYQQLQSSYCCTCSTLKVHVNASSRTGYICVLWNYSLCYYFKKWKQKWHILVSVVYFEKYLLLITVYATGITLLKQMLFCSLNYPIMLWWHAHTHQCSVACVYHKQHILSSSSPH